MIPRTREVARTRDGRGSLPHYNEWRGRGQAAAPIRSPGWARGLGKVSRERAAESEGAVLPFEGGALELPDLFAIRIRDQARLPLLEVDEDERLARRHHQDVVLDPVRGALERDARAADPRDANEDLDQVVEPCRREVLDRRRPHDGLLLLPCVRHQQPEVAVVLDSGRVEIGHVPAVVDDPLRVGVGEADAREGRVAEGWLSVVGPAELERHSRITLSTSSRFCSMRSPERASRFSRRSGSVFEGRTLKCQSSAVTEIPSRCDTSPCCPKRSLSSCSLTATSGTGV